MSDRDASRTVMVEWRALLALACIIFVPCALAGWLNDWSVFAFPLGTFLVSLGIPLGLIVLSTLWMRTTPHEPQELHNQDLGEEAE